MSLLLDGKLQLPLSFLALPSAVAFLRRQLGSDMASFRSESPRPTEQHQRGYGSAFYLQAEMQFIITEHKNSFFSYLEGLGHTTLEWRGVSVPGGGKLD